MAARVTGAGGGSYLSPRVLVPTVSRQTPAVLALFDELRRNGFVEGQNLTVVFGGFEVANEQLPEAAAALVKAAPDVIIAGPQLPLRALQAATRTVPLVGMSEDMVAEGLVTLLARPGGNITGFANYEYPIGGKWLELLKDTAPGRSRVAVLLDSRVSLATQVAYFQGIEAAAPSFGVQLIRAEVHDAAEIERAINDFAQQPNGALIVAPNNATIAHRDPRHRSGRPASLAGGVPLSILRQERWLHFLRNRLGRPIPPGGFLRRSHSQGR